MISLTSIDINGLPTSTIATVVECIHIFRNEKATGKIIIHTGINKQNRRVYAVETRKMIREEQTNE